MIWRQIIPKKSTSYITCLYQDQQGLQVLEDILEKMVRKDLKDQEAMMVKMGKKEIQVLKDLLEKMDKMELQDNKAHQE